MPSIPGSVSGKITCCPCRLPFNRGNLFPRVTDSLLAFFRGNDDGKEVKKDSWRRPHSENFIMSQAPCIKTNGVDSYGDTGVTLPDAGYQEFTFLVYDLSESQFCFGVANGHRAYCKVVDTGVIQGIFGDDSTIVVCGYTADDKAYEGEIVTVRLEWDNSDNSCSIYRNGLLKNTGTYEGYVSTADNVYVGCINNGSPYGYSPLTIARADINGIIFPIAETSGLHSFSTGGQHTITWAGVEAELRAGRQDTYFFNDVHGWYEIDGDSVKYPYPVAGYTEFHKGGTFNNSGTSFAPATIPVGTGNGVDMFIDLDEPYDFIDGDTVSFSFLKNADDIPIIGVSENVDNYIRVNGEYLILNVNTHAVTANLGFVNGVYYQVKISRSGDSYLIFVNEVHRSTITKSGTMTGLSVIYRRGGAYANAITRNLELGNRPVIPINEGSGYDIHDSLGNVVGTLSGDETFWDGPEMVSDEIIKQEAIKTTPVFTDGNGHPVAMTQEEWEANTEINTNKQDYLRTGAKTELALYSEVQDAENDTKLLEWIAS